MTTGDSSAASFSGSSSLDAGGTVPSRFEAMARCFPCREAVKTPETTLTYGELNRAANGMARRIRARGLDPGCPIPIVAERVDTILVALLASWKAGWTSACLDPSWPPAQLASVLAGLEAEIVISDGGRRPRIENLAGGELDRLIPQEATGDLGNGDLPGGPPPAARASIIFTSGSTGSPSGVVHSHRNLVHYVTEQTRDLQLVTRDRMPLLFPMSSMAGLMASLRALLNGATLVAFDMAGKGVEGLPEWVEEERLTLFHALPSVFRRLEAAARGRSQFSTVRFVYLSGEPVTDREVEVFRLLFSKTCLLYNNLGCTEASSYRRFRIEQDTEVLPGRVPVGLAVDGKEVRLLDEAGEEVELGRVGEICVGGTYLSPGYWRNERLTRERFREDPLGGEGSRWYLTGDLGRMRSDGCLDYLGRKDRQVKIRGYRVETEAVDAACRSLPDVNDAVVVSRRRRDGETALVGYLVMAEAARRSTSQLRRDLARRLPGYMVPATLVIVESLPQLPGGKVDRSALPPPGATRPDLATPMVFARSPLEKQLAAVWADVLEVDRVGLNDHFLELGGDSLLAVGLVSQVERYTGRNVPVEKLGSITTLQAMADAMNGVGVAACGVGFAGTVESWPQCRRRMAAVAAGSGMSLLRRGSTVAVINPGGSRRPLFWCFNRYDVEMPMFEEALGSDQPVYGLFSGSGVTAATDSFVRGLAEHYADEVESLQAEGPLLLGGNCRGARVALEMADLLRARGRELGRLCLLEFFDHRLFVEQDPVMLLYGRNSHRKAYEPFRWREIGWEEAFRRPPQVAWVPGDHGEFFTPPNIEVLVGKVRGFLEVEER